MNETIAQLDDLIEMFLDRGSFKPVELHVDQAAARCLVRFRGNPNRFLPKMFDDNWEIFGVHPEEGLARVLRIVIDRKDIPRVILRQGSALYIYTGIPLDD